MRPGDFEFVSKLLKDESGLVVTPEKVYLLESRLMPVARNRGKASLDDLIAEVRLRNDRKLIKEITDAMTTNESFFFRDSKPFELFRTSILPQFVKSRAAHKRFRIWCAAASSGQEPYSIAMILREEKVQTLGWNVEIVGTDISTAILEQAKNGLYSQFEVQRGLPIQMLVKYFDKIGEQWQVKADIRRMVSLREFNLLDNLRSLGKFEVVFCRNVLIYFDQPTKTKVLAAIAELMPEDGLLLLGGAETVIGITDKFKPVPNQRGVYIRT